MQEQHCHLTADSTDSGCLICSLHGHNSALGEDRPGEQDGMDNWIARLNDTVLSDYNTRLAGGFDEPFYRAFRGSAPAEIRFTYDYERSALHELAHWCVAGSARRQQDDYGYWYAPDGRTNAQQQLFFQVEVVPQAIEKHFCAALDLPFAVSVDNLDNRALEGIQEFSAAVDVRFTRYQREGLPERAARIYRCLQTSRLRSQQPHNIQYAVETY